MILGHVAAKNEEVKTSSAIPLAILAITFAVAGTTIKPVSYTHLTLPTIA